MDQQNPDGTVDEVQAETPEDVAVLYSWANLHGAKYRDFSASRREYRAQMRHRQAETQKLAEQRKLAEAEAAAAAAEKAAREAEEAARFHEAAARQAVDMHHRGESEIEEAARMRAMRAAAELQRRASTERIEAARRAEAVAAAEAAARREAREMEEARASAQRQAQRYQESEIRVRNAAGPQPTPIIGGRTDDPYREDSMVMRPDRIYHQPLVGDDDMQPSRFRQSRVIVPQPDPTVRPINDAPAEYRAAAPLAEEADIAAAGAASRLAGTKGPVRFYADDEVRSESYAARTNSEYQRAKADAAAAQARADAPLSRRPQGYHPDEASGFLPPFRESSHAEQASYPAWIGGQHGGQQGGPSQPHAPLYREPVEPLRSSRPSAVEDTLLHSRERVAARWYALKGVFDQGQPAPTPEPPLDRRSEVQVPMLTVFSLAGGVGKTSLVATLGRALSSTGEKVLLADTTSHGLLPFYFGASELRPGLVRTFSPSHGSSDAPIYLVSYDVVGKAGDSTSQDWLAEELATSSRGIQRVLLDLTPSAAWVARRLVRMNSVVLVPVAPDMNSVISLQAVEKFFAGMIDSGGRTVQPYYLLNQFDASLPLHLDVREVMRQQLGDRLLPFVIRRSPAVSEALAEGMTVMDYAPEASVAGDYMNLASWLRTQSAPAQSGFRNARWSER